LSINFRRRPATSVEANTTYEKKLCAQAVEFELGATRVAKLEMSNAKRAADNARLKKALEEAERKGASMEGEIVSLRQGKEATEAKVLKTMEDTMVLITQSFDLAVRQAGVLYGGPPPSGQFDQEIEVFNGRLVPADEVQNLQSIDRPDPNEHV